MSHKSKTTLRKFTSVLMALVMLFSLFPTGLADRLGLEETADAAAEADTTLLGWKIVNEAMDYLGYNYSRTGGYRSGTHQSYDCSGFIWQALTDVGISIGNTDTSITTLPTYWNTGNWIKVLGNQSLALSYNGRNLRIGYAADWTTYNTYKTSGNYDVVIYTGDDTTETMSNSGRLKTGDIVITKGNDSRHAQIIIGHYDYRGNSIDGMTTYFNNTMKSIAAAFPKLNLSTGIAAFNDGRVIDYYTNSNGTKDTLAKFADRVQFGAVYTGQKKYDGATHSAKNSNWLAMLFLKNGTSVGEQETWVIDDASEDSGVRICNSVKSKTSNASAYVMSFPYPYYSSVSVKKTDTSNAGISDTAHFIAMRTPSGVTADTIAKVRNYFLINGKNYYSSQYDGSSLSTIMGQDFGNTTIYNLSSTNSSVDTTSVYSNTSGNDRYYWIFEVGAPNNYDLNTDIFRLEVTPTTSTSGGGSATATRYTTSNTTSTTSVTATSQTGMGSNAAFSNGSSGGTVAVVTIKNSPIIYDQWLTWDLAKTEAGTNTKLADGGYIVIPSNNLGTTNYSGQDRDSAFRYLNNSNSSTNDRRTYSETTGKTYNDPTTAFKALAKYANDNTTTAADAAKKFVEELGNLRGIDKVSGSYRYLSGTTWYQGQEFGYFVTAASGAVQMKRLYVSANGATVTKDENRQIFKIQNDATKDTSAHARDFYILEVKAPSQYEFPSDAAYQMVTAKTDKWVSKDSTLTDVRKTSYLADPYPTLMQNMSYNSGWVYTDIDTSTTPYRLVTSGDYDAISGSDQPSLNDYWTTWSMDKVLENTTNRIANAAYVAVPAQNVTVVSDDNQNHQYYGTTLRGALSELSNSSTSLSDGNLKVKWNGTNYNSLTTLLKAIAKYANDNATGSTDSARATNAVTTFFNQLMAVTGQSNTKTLAQTNYSKTQEFGYWITSSTGSVNMQRATRDQGSGTDGNVRLTSTEQLFKAGDDVRQSVADHADLYVIMLEVYAPRLSTPITVYPADSAYDNLRARGQFRFDADSTLADARSAKSSVIGNQTITKNTGTALTSSSTPYGLTSSSSTLYNLRGSNPEEKHDFFGALPIFKAQTNSYVRVPGATFVATADAATAWKIANGTSTSNGIGTATTTGEKVYFTDNSGSTAIVKELQTTATSVTKDIFVVERTAPGQYQKNPGMWWVRIKLGKQTDGKDATIVGAWYYYNQSNFNNNIYTTMISTETLSLNLYGRWNSNGLIAVDAKTHDVEKRGSAVTDGTLTSVTVELRYASGTKEGQKVTKDATNTNIVNPVILKADGAYNGNTKISDTAWKYQWKDLDSSVDYTTVEIAAEYVKNGQPTTANTEAKVKDAFETKVTRGTTATGDSSTHTNVTYNYYGALPAVKVATGTSDPIANATFVATSSLTVAQQIANGTSTSNGIGTVTTGTTVKYFTNANGSTAIVSELCTSSATAPTTTIYIAEKTKPNRYEKNTGVWEVTLKLGVQPDGKDATITGLKYYATSTSSATNLTTAVPTIGTARAIGGHYTAGSATTPAVVYLADTMTHTVIKNGSAVTDGTLYSVNVELRYASGANAGQKVTKDADGSNIVNPVTLRADGAYNGSTKIGNTAWTYEWTGLDSSVTYTTEEVQAVYYDAPNHTTTLNGLDAIKTVFRTALTRGTTSTGSKTTHNNGSFDWYGALAIVKTKTNDSAAISGGEYVVTDTAAGAWAVVNGGTYTALGTATSGTDPVYFVNSDNNTAILSQTFTSIDTAPTWVVYVAESKAPAGYERNKGIWQVTIEAGVETDGKDASIKSVKYYASSTASAVNLSTTAPTAASVAAIGGHYTDSALFAAETISVDITKEGAAVTDGTLNGVRVELRNAETGKKVTKDAAGNAIVNPVILKADGAYDGDTKIGDTAWYYKWTGLNSSLTYTIVETGANYNTSATTTKNLTSATSVANVFKQGITKSSAATGDSFTLTNTTYNYYAALPIVKEKTNSTAKVAGGKYVVTTDADTAWAIANGTSTSSGIGTATTSTSTVYFEKSGSTAILSKTFTSDTTAPTWTVYMAEQTAPVNYERNPGVWEITIKGGTQEDGKDARITGVKYYRTATSDPITVGKTRALNIYGFWTSTLLHAYETTTIRVVKDGPAVDDGTLVSVTLELRDSAGNKIETDANGDLITNPVTIDADCAWAYEWELLDSSKTYTVAEVGAKYKTSATTTATLTSEAEVAAVFEQSLTKNSTDTGYEFVVTNTVHNYYGALPLVKVATGTTNAIAGAEFVATATLSQAWAIANGTNTTNNGIGTLTTAATAKYFENANSSTAIVTELFTSSMTAPTKTVYIVERTSPAGYERNAGVWEVTLRLGVQPDGKDATITGLKYYASSTANAVNLSTTVPASGSAAAIGGHYTAGSATTPAVVYAAETKSHEVEKNGNAITDGTIVSVQFELRNKATHAKITADAAGNAIVNPVTLKADGAYNGSTKIGDTAWHYKWTGLDSSLDYETAEIAVTYDTDKTATGDDEINAVFTHSVSTESGETGKIDTHTNDSRGLYAAIAIVKTKTNSDSAVPGATYAVTETADAAWAIANGTGSNGIIATATTAAAATYFETPAGSTAIRKIDHTSMDSTTWTVYVAEQTAPASYEKTTGIWKIVLNSGEQEDGKDATIESITYYKNASDTTGTALSEVAAVYGKYTGDTLYAPETKSHTVTKNGNAVTEGIITSVTVELRTSAGDKVTTDAYGNAITNPVTISEANNWTYKWTGLDSSMTYTTVETAVEYIVTGTTKATATATSTPSMEDIFAMVTEEGTSADGSTTTITNNLYRLNGGAGVIKYYIDYAGNEQRANGIVFGVFSDAACQNKIDEITTEGQGVAEYTLPTWLKSESATKTLYIKELDNSNAVSVATGKALKLEAPSTRVIKAVVTGAEDGADSTVVYTVESGSPETVVTANGVAYVDYKEANETTPLHAWFSFAKYDFKNRPQIVSFDVYTTNESGTLSGLVSTKAVTLVGNMATVTWTSDELLGTTKWASDDPADKVWYIRENKDSVPEGYNWNDTIYTVTARGAEDIVDSRTTIAGGQPVDDSYNTPYTVINTSNRIYGGIGVYKYTVTDETTDPVTVAPVKGVVFTVYTDAECQNAIATLTTEEDGTAVLNVSDLADAATEAGEWHRSDVAENGPKTYYIVETDVSGAQIKEGETWVNRNVKQVSDVIKAEVTGTESATDLTAGTTYANISAGEATPLTKEITVAGIKYIGYQLANNIVYVKASIGVMKEDDSGATVKGLKFNIYENGATVDAEGTVTGTLITTITTGTTGLATIDVSEVGDGVVAEGFWNVRPEDNATKTFYIQEDKESAESLNLIWDSRLVKATATAVALDAEKTVATYEVDGTDITKHASSLDYCYFLQTNTKIKKVTATKTFGDQSTASLVKEVWMTLYDDTGAVVTTDAAGNAITNPVDVLATEHTYTWTKMNYYKTYNVKETKVVLNDGTEIAEADLPTWFHMTESAETSDTNGDQKFTKDNTAIVLKGKVVISKTDDKGNALSATFELYSDAACTTKLDTVVANSTYTYTTEWLQGAGTTKTIYIKETTANVGGYVPFPYVIKAVMTGAEDINDATVVFTCEETGTDASRLALAAENGYTAQITSETGTHVTVEGVTVYVPNKPNQIPISKKDVTTQDEIKDAQLKVITKQAITWNGVDYEAGAEIDSWTSEEGVTHYLWGVPEGNYTLSETKAPTEHGYTTSEDVDFTVDTEHVVHDAVVMYDDHTELRISKRELSTDEDVAGATLRLYNESGTVQITWTTNDDNSISIVEANTNLEAYAEKINGRWEIVIEYIPVGTYTLEETNPAKGYVKAADLTVTIDDAGKQTKIHRATMYDDVTKVRISKRDFTNAATIPGAVLELVNAAGDCKITWTTGSNGSIVIDQTGTTARAAAVKDGDDWFIQIERIPAGSYTLKETTAANGYAKAEDITFNVTSTGDIQSQTMYDKPLEGIISKTDITTGAPVIDAKLQIVTKQDIIYKGKAYKAGEVIDEWTTDGTDHHMPYIPVGEYTLIEVLAPTKDGYVKANDVDFEIILVTDSNINGETTVKTVVDMDDDYTKIAAAKTDAYGHLIEGATMQLITKSDITWYNAETQETKDFAAGSVVAEWVSGTEAKVFRYLPAGDYVLRETAAPNGMALADDVEFTVAETADLVTVTMTDNRLAKLPSTGTADRFMYYLLAMFFIMSGAAGAVAQKKRKKA